MARINTHWGERALSVNFPGRKTFWLSLFRPSLGKHTLLFSLSPSTFHYSLACFLSLFHFFPTCLLLLIAPLPFYLSPHHPLLPLPPTLSLSMDNSSVLLRAAVCLPAYCDFHWDSFRDHSHLDWELEPRLQREINHTHLILTRIHARARTHTRLLTLLSSPPNIVTFFFLF